MGDLTPFDDRVPTTTQQSVSNTTSTPIFYDRHSCNSSTLVPGLNGSCVPIGDANV